MRSDIVNPAERHLQSLDGLRGIAVISVLIYHSTFVNSAGHGAALRVIGNVTSSGWVGVDVFFCLSGFLITSILLKAASNEDFLRNFYIRRVLRIFPLYYVVLLVCMGLTPLLHIQWHGTIPYFIAYLQNYAPYAALSLTCGHISLHLEHFWSLAVEEQFYIVWPFLILFVGARRRFIAIPLTLVVLCPMLRAIAIAVGMQPISLYVWTPFRIDDLAWGAVGALIVRFWPGKTRMWGVLIGTAGLIGIAVLVARQGSLVPEDSLVQRYGFTAIGAAVCALLLLLAAQVEPLTKVFSNASLRWFGKYSYGIYVFHYIFFDMYQPVRHFVAVRTGSKGLGALALVATTFMVGCGLAWLSYNFFEQHFLKMKESLTQHARKPAMAG